MNQIDIDLNVIDLYNGKILSAKETPKVEGNLAEVLRQFSGQTYMISRFTDCKDFEGRKLYEYDFVEIYKFKEEVIVNDWSGDPIERTIIGEGFIQFNHGSFRVNFINKKSGESDFKYLSDMEVDFKKIGDYFYKK